MSSKYLSVKRSSRLLPNAIGERVYLCGSVGYYFMPLNWGDLRAAFTSQFKYVPQHRRILTTVIPWRRPRGQFYAQFLFCFPSSKINCVQPRTAVRTWANFISTISTHMTGTTYVSAYYNLMGSVLVSFSLLVGWERRAKSAARDKVMQIGWRLV